MAAMEELSELADSMRQASAVLADEVEETNDSSDSRRARFPFFSMWSHSAMSLLGMELYPRIGKYFDIKVFTNCRFGMMSWAVLALTCDA